MFVGAPLVADGGTGRGRPCPAPYLLVSCSWAGRRDTLAELYGSVNGIDDVSVKGVWNDGDRLVVVPYCHKGGGDRRSLRCFDDCFGVMY